MRILKSVTILLLLFALVALSASCAKNKKTEPETTPEPVTAAEPADRTPPPSERREVVEDFPEEKPIVADIEQPSLRELNEQGVLQGIFFAYDRSELTDEARRILRDNGAWLQRNRDYNVVIEGHCDERGTIEYNLALGERRAKSVREYLGTLGVDAKRMRIISFGEERPVALGSNESAWSQNRRGVFVLEQ